MHGFREWTGSDGEGPPPFAPGWEGANPEPPPVKFKRLDEFLAEYEPLSYALEPIIRTGSLYTLTAKTGAGKTAWMISTALAVATGREDILGIEVLQGRIAFLTFENPDDVRMRLKISAYLLNVDVRDVAGRLLIVDMRASPEAILAGLKVEVEADPFALVFVDTLAAMFDGDDINSAVQGGNFLRRLRPMTKVAGSPAVVVAAHPVKNALADQLIPYGSGAILNEVDGNLTLWRKAETGTVEFHWQGKLRGLEFQPAQFRFEVSTSPEVVDAKGREVALPTMVPARMSEADEEAKAAARFATRIALMKAIQTDPKASFNGLAKLVDCSKSRVQELLNDFKAKGLAQNPTGPWALTSKGEKELERWG